MVSAEVVCWVGLQSWSEFELGKFRRQATDSEPCLDKVYPEKQTVQRLESRQAVGFRVAAEPFACGVILF
jgi:hypothetical protein